MSKISVLIHLVYSFIFQSV